MPICSGQHLQFDKNRKYRLPTSLYVIITYRFLFPVNKQCGINHTHPPNRIIRCYTRTMITWIGCGKAECVNRRSTLRVRCDCIPPFTEPGCGPYEGKKPACLNRVTELLGYLINLRTFDNHKGSGCPFGGDQVNVNVSARHSKVKFGWFLIMARLIYLNQNW